jgi:hypothetical protein
MGAGTTCNGFARTAIAAGEPKEMVNAQSDSAWLGASSGFLHSPFGFDSGDAAKVAGRCNTAAYR